MKINENMKASDSCKIKVRKIGVRFRSDITIDPALKDGRGGRLDG
jgi:hypothetical protein